MEWLFSLLRFRNKYVYCLGIRKSVRRAFWILLSMSIAITTGILIVCFTITKGHRCHFGFKRMMNSSIVVGSRPRSVAVGDFNNDDRPDFVVANSGTNTIGIFLAESDGVFAKQQTYLADFESHPCSVAVAHLNDDDYLDIAVASYTTNNISIFLGHGDGTFDDPRQFSTGSSHPLFVATGDVNNDNATDLVVVNYGTNSIGVLLGYGNGSFQHQRNYFTEYDSLPHSLAIGDFNNDNYLDIAVANYGTSNIGIFLNYGNGTFANQNIYTTLSNSHPSSLALGDFDHDNQLDVVVSNNGSGNIGIFFGHGDGTFEGQRIYPIESRAHPAYITVDDLNGDNELDVIIVDSINDRVHILRGDGNGSFATLTTYDTISESSPMSVAAADFNNNNQSDLVVVNSVTNDVLVLMDYRIRPSARKIPYKTGDQYHSSVVVSDFNNDHISDILYTKGEKIFIMNGLDDGTFDERAIYTMSTSVNYIGFICVGDVNNDTWMDIVTANPLNDNVGVLLGRGNGTFGSMTTAYTGSQSVPARVVLGDMNDDGRLDIVCANALSGNIGILFGNGDGTFATMITITASDFSPTSLALGDIDHDDRLDIIVLDERGYIFVFIEFHLDTITLLPIIPVNHWCFLIVLADLNSDNDLDLAVTDVDGNSIDVFLGYGNGTFATQRIYPIGEGALPYRLLVADFNNDHISDLAATVISNDEVIILYGNGDGSFTLARRYSTGSDSKPDSIAVAAFDHNKQLKIIVTLLGTGELAVLTEYTAAEFVSEIVYSTGSTAQPFSVAADDFTRDNRSDVVVANSGTGDLNVLIGSGNGTFDTKMVYLLGVNSRPQYVITCDIDQDQALDIVSVDSKLSTITIMMGQNDGTFASERTYSTGNDSRPSAVASGDLNNDGQLDLVVANEYTDSIRVLFGFNYTTFQSPMVSSNNDSLHPYGIVVSDFNSDGVQDISVASDISGKIGIYFGCGNGSFVLTTTFSIGNGTIPWVITASDLNNDGQADLVVSDRGSNDTNNIAILLGYGNGSFAAVRSYSSGGWYPVSVAVGDMNNDNRLDLVVANIPTDNVTVLYGYGDGTFSRAYVALTKHHFQVRYIVLGDLNSDGRLDIIVFSMSLGVGDIHIIRGNGTARHQGTSPTIANSQPQFVVAADFNNDNRLDIATIGSANDIEIYLNKGNGILASWVSYSTGSVFAPTSIDAGDFNNDSITDIVFASFIATVLLYFWNWQWHFSVGKTIFNWQRIHTTGLVIADFNNDARLDVAVSNSYANNVAALLGSENEPFGNGKTYATGEKSRPHSVVLGDVNNDHRMDIVVANYGSDNIGVLLGLSNREFTPIITYPTGTDSAPYCVAVADFNNDGCLDIVVTNSETDNIIVFLGYGNGTFINGAIYSTGYRSRPYILVINDFNNDKIWDIAIANSGTSNIFLLYGHENGTFGNEASYSLGYGYHPYSVAATDLNGDGWMDIVIACYDTDHIEVLIQKC